MLRVLLLSIASVSGLLLSSSRIGRNWSLRSTSSHDTESSKWMAEYLVRVHEARIDAVARAREEASKDALDRINELESQLSEIRSAKSAASTPAPETEAVLPETEKGAPTEAVVETVKVAMHPVYEARIRDIEYLKQRWGEEEIGRIQGRVESVPHSKKDEKVSMNPNYQERLLAEEALASRWGDEELQRIQQQ